MGRPVWLLDVDGVINVARPGWSRAPYCGNAYSEGYHYRMRWSPALIKRIRALHDSGTVDIRWCSTWCSESDQLERLFGLPRFDRCWDRALTGVEAAAPKLAAARAVLDRGLHLVWTDDVEVPTSGPVHEEMTGDGRALLIAPSPRRGLQPEDMDAIEEFVARIAEADRRAQADSLLLARRLLGDPGAIGRP